MSKWCTVAIVQPYYFKRGLENAVPLGQDVYLGPIPSWLKDKNITEVLDLNEKETVNAAPYCFVVEYETNSLGEPDPDWKEPARRTILSRVLESTMFANLGLWLARPSAICFELIMHCQCVAGEWHLKQYSKCQPLAALPQYEIVLLERVDFECARLLHSSMATLPRRGAVWTAIGPLWTALCEKAGEKRYLFHWIALEALLGPAQPGEITYRLSQRIAFFLASNSEERKEIFRIAKRAYRLRSKVVHGMRLEKLKREEADKLMLKTELWVRESLKKILHNNELIKVFSGKDRESYLDDLVLSG